MTDYAILDRLAYYYYLWTERRFTVTRGTRTASEQAKDMYDNWHYHRNERTHYKDREAEREIRQAYESSTRAREPGSATVEAMTSVIENQVRRHSFISLHLLGRAADVRTRDMSGEEYHVFELLANHFVEVTLLHEGNHYHLQFR